MYKILLNYYVHALKQLDDYKDKEFDVMEAISGIIENLNSKKE